MVQSELYARSDVAARVAEIVAFAFVHDDVDGVSLVDEPLDGVGELNFPTGADTDLFDGGKNGTVQ